MRTGKPVMSTASRPDWTTRASVRNTVIGKTRDAWNTPTAATRMHWLPSTALARCEGILPALESSHAVAQAMRLAAAGSPEQTIVVCLSGRGDKDAAEIARSARIERAPLIARFLGTGVSCLPLTSSFNSDVPPDARPSCRSSRPAIRTWISRRQYSANWPGVAVISASWESPTATLSRTAR